MAEAELKICTGEPDEFDSAEIDDFVAFVLAGGEVQTHGKLERDRRQI